MVFAHAWLAGRDVWGVAVVVVGNTRYGVAATAFYGLCCQTEALFIVGQLSLLSIIDPVVLVGLSGL